MLVDAPGAHDLFEFKGFRFDRRAPSGCARCPGLRSYQDGMRLAGERDHADEDADFNMPADEILHSERAGPTPTTATYSWGRSIPEAVGLKYSGLGGSLADEAQDRLRRKMAELTAGDLSRPIIAVGCNSERFDGRNLALRLAALGYTQVYWSRGGREA